VIAFLPILVLFWRCFGEPSRRTSSIGESGLFQGVRAFDRRVPRRGRSDNDLLDGMTTPPV